MSIYYVYATNSYYRSSAQAKEYDGPAAALEAGVASAIAIVSEEIRTGRSNAAVEVSVADLDNNVVLRSVVNLSVSNLMTAPANLNQPV
jgi:hypothetical protein